MKKFVCICLLCCMTFIAGCIDYSKGERTGTITKFSEKGVLFNTWEGEMVLGGNGASGNSDNTWKFSVDNNDIADIVMKIQRKGGVVTVKYHQEMIVPVWRADTKYFIDGIVEE